MLRKPAVAGRNRTHPIPMVRAHPVLGSIGCVVKNFKGTQIGRHNRDPGDPVRKGFSGQKKSGGGFHPSLQSEADRQHGYKIGKDDRHIERMQFYQHAFVPRFRPEASAIIGQQNIQIAAHDLVGQN